MGNFFRKNRLELLIFALVFLIFSFFSARKFLFYDDITFGFSAVTKDYLNFYKNYIMDYGLFRPFALIYYFFIYEIFFSLPQLAHLIPLALLTITSFFTFQTLYVEGLSKKQSFMVGIFLLSIPFVTETYSWLSANTSIIVLFIFFLQVYLIEKNSIKKGLLSILILIQTISVFFYESTIFMSIALAYLLYTKRKIKNKIKLAIYSIFPVLIYFISKIVIRPQFENRSKFITIPEAFSHWQTFLSQLRMLFSPNYIRNFWGLEFINGLSYISNNIFILSLLVTTIFLLIVYLFMKERKKEKGDEIFYNHNVFFWPLTFILSLIPLSWQTDYLPFRTLILPIIILLINLFLIINLILTSQKVKEILQILAIPFKIIFILMTFVFITVQISMINQYVKQFMFDTKIVLEIDKKLENSGFEHPYRSNLLLKNMPNNNVERIVYGDYIYGLFHNFWSAKAFLDLNSGSFLEVGIEMKDDNSFVSKISKNELLNLKPLTIMSFTNNESCLKGKCLKVEAIYQKPY